MFEIAIVKSWFLDVLRFPSKTLLTILPVLSLQLHAPFTADYPLISNLSYMEKFAVFCLLSLVCPKKENQKSNDQQFLDKNLPHPERWRRVGAVAFYPFICVLLVPRRGGSFVLFPGRRSQAQWMLVKRFARGKNCLLIVKLIQSWTTHTHTETYTNSHRPSKGWLRLSEWITVSVCVCVRFVCNGSEDEGC